MDEIRTALDGVCHGLAREAATAVQGQGVYWHGPLDVQGLAASSVGLAVASARRLARARGRSGDAITARLPDVVAAFGSIARLRVDGEPVPGFAPASGFFPTADGWVRTHANYPHHRDRLLRALAVPDEAHLATAVSGLPTTTVEDLVTSAGGIAVAVRSEEQWRAAAAETPGPWIRVASAPPPGDVPARRVDPVQLVGADTAWRPDRGTADLPLSGVRVVSLTRVIAGPTATKFLAALGADVVRIDPPHLPELKGHRLDTDLGISCLKRDLRSSRHIAEFQALLASADVLLTGYRPGSLDALGLSPSEVAQRFPHLVHVDLSAWDPTGPRAAQRGFDSIVQAATGIAALCGSPDDHGGVEPGALPVQALDHATGYGMAAAACALLARGGGGHAHLSLERTARVLMDMPLPSPHTAAVPLPPLPEPVTLRHGHRTRTWVPSPVRVNGVLHVPATTPG